MVAVPLMMIVVAVVLSELHKANRSKLESSEVRKQGGEKARKPASLLECNGPTCASTHADRNPDSSGEDGKARKLGN